MRDPSTEEAARLLESADDARARGSAAVRRPSWYAIALGLCVALALGGFAVPGMATTGLVLGGVVLPLAIDLEVRRRIGSSPAKSYLEPLTRTTTITAVLIGTVIAAISLVALKVTGESWVVLPGAALLGVGTAVAARRIDHLRAGAGQPTPPRS